MFDKIKKYVGKPIDFVGNKVDFECKECGNKNKEKIYVKTEKKVQCDECGAEGEIVAAPLYFNLKGNIQRIDPPQ